MAAVGTGSPVQDRMDLLAHDKAWGPLTTREVIRDVRLIADRSPVKPTRRDPKWERVTKADLRTPRCAEAGTPTIVSPLGPKLPDVLTVVKADLGKPIEWLRGMHLPIVKDGNEPFQLEAEAPTTSFTMGDRVLECVYRSLKAGHGAVPGTKAGNSDDHTGPEIEHPH